MYCPRCGQQSNQETNFCPRCGFYFAALKELVQTGGVVPQTPMQATVQGGHRSARQKGIRFGAKIVFFSVVLLPIFFGMSLQDNSAAPMLIPLILFLTGAAWMLYARLFLDSARISYQPPAQVPVWNAQSSPAIAPPQNYLSSPPPAKWQADTGEIVPASVTEQTTNLLDR